jgi:hypothetical protein
MFRFIKRFMNPDKKMVITKVLVESEASRMVIFENKEGAREVFKFDGRIWHWYISGHIVIPELAKRLDKAYKKWSRNSNRVIGGRDEESIRN